MLDPASIQLLALHDSPEAARAALEEALRAGVPEDPDPVVWARLAELLGHSLLAIAAWQAALRRDPSSALARERLLALYEARGDEASARALRAGPPAPSLEEDEAPAAPLPGASAADLLRFVDAFGGRAGVHARQWARGEGARREVGWSPVQTPLGPDLALAHLKGELTLGSYLVRHGDRCAQLAFDLDARPEALERAWGHPERVKALRATLHEAGLVMAGHLTRNGLDPLLVDSGFKGRHLWCLLQGEPLAAEVRRAAFALLRSAPPLPAEVQVEVFPKQDRVPPGGLGNLIKLPLGIHLRTMRRADLLDEAGRPLADPWPRLRALQRRPLPLGRAAEAPAPPPLMAAEPALPTEPAPPAPPFGEADFEARPRLAALLRGCPVIREIVDQVVRNYRIEADAAVVLEHSMGHLAEGVEAVNYLGGLCPGAQLSMGAPHRGSVISCNRIRQRVPRVAQAVRCDCRFEGEHRYPNPLLHLGGSEIPTEAPPVLLEDQLAALGRLEARLRRLETERDGLRRYAAERLGRLPEGRLRLREGVWSVEEVEGIPTVRFEPAGGGA